MRGHCLLLTRLGGGAGGERVGLLYEADNGTAGAALAQHEISPDCISGFLPVPRGRLCRAMFRYRSSGWIAVCPPLLDFATGRVSGGGFH